MSAMEDLSKLMENRSTATIFLILATLPLSIIVGAIHDFHWGYLTFCAQVVLLGTWRTLHDGVPKFRLFLIVLILALVHVVALAMCGEQLRSISSFAITLIFIVDFVISSWIAGRLLRFKHEIEIK